jgi:hypothetical protein
MTFITLVSTIHEEIGVTTASALHNILEQLRPKAIFLEIPEAAFAAFRGGTKPNLEFSAATLYLASNDVALVPADLPTPDEALFREDEYLHRRAWQTSPAYRDLLDLHSTATSTIGLPYLNSDQCSDAWAAIYEAKLTALLRLPDHAQLLAHYNLWKDTNERRDRAMLDKTEAYCLDNPLDRGVLLVGAAHRKSLLSITRERTFLDTTRVEWSALHLPYERGITTA